MSKSVKHGSEFAAAAAKPVEVFEASGIQLWRGDVLRLLPLVPDGSVDLVLTDPPYCSGGLGTSARQADPASKYCQSRNTLGRPSFVGDTRDQRSFAFWCTAWLTLAREASKESAYCIVFIDWRNLPAMTDAMQAAGWIWRGIAAWNKGRGARAPHKGFFRHQCEYIVWGTNGAVPQPTDRGPFDGCYDFTVKQSDKFHMTGKPTPLLRELVKVAPSGGKILDPFSGSATTGVAAALEGRQFLGMEATSEYFEIGKERLSAAAQGVQLSRPKSCR